MLPSRLALKRPEGSASEAPRAKVIFTTSLYVSPVQMMPAHSHTGTPRHFHASATPGQASLMRLRTRASISPRQSPNSLIRPSISREAEAPPFPSFAPVFVFFMAVAFFVLLSLARHFVRRRGHGASRLRTPALAKRIMIAAPRKAKVEARRI